MKLPWLLVALLLIASSSVSFLVDAQGVTGYTVRFAQLVHREGVSIPDVTTDQAAICGSASLCGSLTEEGMAQQVVVGNYARTRYNDASIVGASNAFFPLQTYSPSLLSSYAVAYSRTLQSSAAFLAGVFPNMNSFYPSIISANATTDLVLSTDSLPPVMLKRFVDKAGLEAVLAPVVDNLFSWTELQSAAGEAQFTGCTQSNRGQCAIRLYNLYQYYSSLGQLTTRPTLSAAASKLTTVQQAYFEYVFGYDASVPLQKQQGSMGQNIAEQLISNMRHYMTSSPSHKMVEYSTQDSVITPLAVTLGIADADPTAYSPAYSESYFVELLESNSAAGSYYAHAFRGAPTTAGSFSILPFTLRCMSEANVVYTATNNICPLNDFIRYIESTASSEADGACIVSQEQYEMLGCPTNNRLKSVSLNTYCDLYRVNCPNVACQPGYVLNAADLKCYLTAKGPSGEYNVRMAQVVHRHGARAPLVDFNVSEICGFEYPCSYLNGVGIDMLLSIGDYVRNRYNSLDVVESPFFESERYNSSLVYTRSTSLERTLQSAASFLHALFPDSRYFFPVIYSVNMTTDFLLNTDPMPPVMLKRWANDEGLSAALNPVVDSLFTWEELQAGAEEAYIGGTCVDYDLRWECALDVYDVGTSFKATNQLGDKPRLAAILPGATEVNTQYFFYIFAYNASLEMDRTQGTMAQNLAQEMLGNVYAHLLSPSYRLFEYSTHDTLVAPLGVTLGDQGHATMEVPYAHTYIMELLQDAGDDSYHIRILRGSPQDADNSGNFTFVQDSFTQHCIDEAGNTYEATNNVCPLEDFARFIDSTRPAVHKGYCVVDQTMYNNLDCPSSAFLGKPVPRYCQIYRIGCGDMACENGYVLAQDDLQCYPVDPNATTSTSTTLEPAVVPHSVPVPVPAAKRLSEARRRELAADIARGVADGTVFLAALGNQGETTA